MLGYIMVVDDDPTILESLAMIIDLRGIRHRTAANGEAALATAEQETPALIFVDLNLPYMDGIQVLRELRARGILVPAVLMSASARDLHDRARENGFAAYLSKPFPIAEIYSLVDRFAA